MNAKHRLAPRGLVNTVFGALVLWPMWAVGQQAADTSQGPTATPYERNWRDHFTPFQDPVATEPARLHRPLSIPLPPDLLTPAANGLQRDGETGPLPSEWACANRSSATHADNSAWTLERLRADAVQTGPATTATVSALPVLNLPTAIHLALCHNPQMRATWSTIAQQAAQLGQAQSAYWPQLNAGIARQRSRVSHSGSELPASSTWATSKNAVLNWRLWDFGARGAKADAAQAQLTAVLHTQDATVHKALAEVLQAYGQAQATQASLETQRTLLPLAERSVQAAQRRQQGGAGSGNDTLQTLAAQARIQLEQSRAQGELDKTTAQLAYLLGLPGSASHQPSHPLLMQALDNWLEQARQSHPAILAAKAQWQAAQASLKAVQSEGLLALDFNLAHYRNGRPNVAITGGQSRENVIGLTLSIPLFDGFSTTYKVRAA